MKRLLKHSLYLMLFVSLAHASDWHPTKEASQSIIVYLTAQLPKGWSIFYDDSNARIEVRKEVPVLSILDLANGPTEPPEPHTYKMSFQVSPFISQASYARLKDENQATQNKMDRIKDELRHSPTATGFMDFFRSENAADKEKIADYRHLESTLHKLPDFYFETLALREEPNPVKPISPSDRSTCDSVEKDVMDSLSKY